VSNVQKGSATQLTPSIVLLEDYSALATAITSALRKFAPRHSTHTARSLKELESLSAKLQPELLVIDVDPPWPKLTQSLGKLRSAHPATRALVIGATVPKEIIDQHGSERALQFLQKPFDVPELGAAVQALVGPWTHEEKLRGTLRCFNAIDAALLQCASGRSVILDVSKKNSTKTGELHFVDGQLRHAENGRRSGVEALEELFSWKEPEVHEKERKSRTAPKRTIPAPWTEAFLEALRGSEADAEESVSHAPPPPEPKHEARTGKSIVLIDDTDMLLLFVEDVLATEDPSLRISTAPSGAAGVKAVAEILPDLVLLDYSLPDFNGDEVCRRLLENERTAKIPILMMSGHVLEMNRTASEMENVVATIEKPFLSEALVALVRETLESPPAPRPKKQPAPEPAPQPVVEVPPTVAPQQKSVPAAPPVIPARSQRTTASEVDIPEQSQPTERKEQAPPTPPAPVVAAPPPPPPKVETTPPAPVAPAAKPPPRPPAVPIEYPVPHVIEVVQSAPPRPPVQTLAPFPARIGQEPAAAVPVFAQKPNEIVLGLFLEVVSIQLTPSLRLGTLRARPSSQTISLQVALPVLMASLPPTGFQLGAVDLDRNGRIANLRVKPSVQPFTPQATRNSLQIGGVSLVPHNSHENLQLTPTPNAPMRMQLIAHIETAGVELSNTFQVSNIVLKNRSNRVRVTLSEQAITPEKTGTVCEITSVQIDGAAHIVELTLNPV
jgi:DNA-binding response OmpR family regulator